MANLVQAAPTLPGGFSTQLVAGNLGGPVAFDFAPGNRLFVASKDGRVRVIVDGQVETRLFVDYRAAVNNQRDRGLLGIAVHPDFPTEPYVYLLMTYDPPEIQPGSGPEHRDGTGNRVARLVRLQADPAKDFNAALGTNASGFIVDPTYETVLLGSNSTFSNIGDPAGDRHSPYPSCNDGSGPIVDCIPADETTHTIGSVRFGIEGALYVSSGDGSGAVGGVNANTIRAQNLDSLAGKLLRIHPLTGEAYADNPWFDGDFDANRAKVWNFGLRNPFRFTINPTDGSVWIGDVGWGLWEEINTGAGKNFGWPCYEGNASGSAEQPAYKFEQDCIDRYADGLAARVTAPVFAFAHGGSSASVQMGDFYLGDAWPEEYQGSLFYSDINRRIIDRLEFDANGELVANHQFATNASGITQIQRGPDTNLYYADIYANEIRRIIYTAGGNTPPNPVISATPLSGEAPLTVTVDASASFDADAHDLTFAWDFGDGATAVGDSANNVYTNPGSYQVRLSATDSLGASNTVSETITVGNNAPSATILSVNNASGGSGWQIGDRVYFIGAGSDPEDGALSADALTWTATVLHNNHVHLDYFNGTGDSGEFEYLDHEDNSFLRLCLSVTDAGGLSDSDCTEIRPDEIDITIDSVPQGLQLTYESTTAVTPFTVRSALGATRSIVAPSTQGKFEFQSWSDDGASSHRVTISPMTASYIATYADAAEPIACGQPDLDLAADRGLFMWRDCATNRFTLYGLDGGSVRRVTHAGRIESDAAFIATGSEDYEPQYGDSIDFAGDGSVDYVFHTKNARFDGLWFDLAPGAGLCVGLDNAAGSTIYLGPQATAYTMPIDPLSLRPCVGLGPNRPPIVEPIADQYAAAGDPLTLQVLASDPDQDALQFVAIGLPRGLAMSSSGEISGKPTADSVGDHAVAVDVSDGTATTRVSFRWSIRAAGATTVCGKPDFNPATNRGHFLWSDCATGRYFLHVSDGGSSSRVTHVGNIDSDAAFTATGTVDYEPQYDDQFSTTTPGRISYRFHSKGGHVDGLWFEHAPQSEVCVGLGQASGSRVVVGAQGTEFTLPIDPVTLQSCSSPLQPNAPDYCYAPSFDPAVDAGIFIWKDCGSVEEYWHIRTGAGGSNTVHRYDGNLESIAGNAFGPVAKVSNEGGDVLAPANITTSFNFVHRMFGAGFDGVDFKIDANSSVCFRQTYPPNNVQVFVGENRLARSGSFDIETLAPCQ